jgi:hypothetical protein
VSNSQVAIVTGGARGIKTDYDVPATKQATLDRLAKLAAHSGLGVEIAGSFTFEQGPAAFRAFVAGMLLGKYVMKREDK